MKSTWVKGLVDKKREEIEREFVASSLLRSRLTLISKEKIETKRAKKISEDEYSNPNWAMKQADAIGYERALNEIISLLEK